MLAPALLRLVRLDQANLTIGGGAVQITRKRTRSCPRTAPNGRRACRSHWRNERCGFRHLEGGRSESCGDAAGCTVNPCMPHNYATLSIERTASTVCCSTCQNCLHHVSSLSDCNCTSRELFPASWSVLRVWFRGALSRQRNCLMPVFIDSNYWQSRLFCTFPERVAAATLFHMQVFRSWCRPSQQTWQPKVHNGCLAVTNRRA